MPKTPYTFNDDEFENEVSDSFEDEAFEDFDFDAEEAMLLGEDSKMPTFQDEEEDIDTEDPDEELIDFGDNSDFISAEQYIAEANKETENKETSYSSTSIPDNLELKEDPDKQQEADESGVSIKLEDDDTEYAEETITPMANSFIDAEGRVKVMNPEDTSNENTFELILLEYKNIATARRIRKNKSVEDLYQSIKSTGLLYPIVVAPTATENIYVLIDGYRRILACAKAGIKQIPAIINKKVDTTEVPIIEALYNHRRSYTIEEMIDYIEYLEKELGIMSSSLIEYLLQMDNGDYSKLKDILADDDEDIVTKLLGGQFTISQAFKALEKRRAKESKEEKDLKKAAKVYGDIEESGAEVLSGTGETGDGEGLSDEEIAELSINPKDLDEGLEDTSLNEMLEEGKATPGFHAHQQKVGEREYIDPLIKKSVLARDNFTCACCKRGGESFVDALDYHHIVPVFLGGKDTPENGVTLCLTDHRLVHLYAAGDLHLAAEKTEEELEKLTEEEKIIYNDEQMRFKRIVKLGQTIRDGMAKQGMSRERFKKEHPVGSIGRNKPGQGQTEG